MDVVKNAAGRAGEATQPAAVSTGYRNYVLAILTLTYTLNFLDRQIIGILAVPLKAEFQLSDSEFGLLGGLAFALLYSTLAVPIAWLADRVSRVWIMTVALSLWSGFTALCGTAASFTQLFLFRMGVGIGEAGGVAPAYSLIAEYFPRHRRARAMAVFSLGYPLGAAAGTLVGGLVAATYGWRTAFFVVGILGVVIAPLMRLTIRDPQRGGLGRVVQPQDGATGADTARLAAAAPPIGETLRYLLQKPSFWLMAFACAALRPDITYASAREAYEMAGVGAADLDLVELHDAFTIAELVYYEALGLCAPGESVGLIRDGRTTYGGDVIVNPSGGLLSKGHPVGASGAAQAVEIFWQLTGQVGGRQVDDAKLALSHVTGGGIAGVDHGVCTVHLYEGVA